MTRCLLLAALAVVLGVPVQAQSDLSGSPFALGASGSYAGAVSHSGGYDLDRLRAPGVSLDIAYGRLSAGAGLAFYDGETAVNLAAGLHLARNPEALLATTAGVSLQLLQNGTTSVTPSISHARRVFGTPGIAVVPGASVGLVGPLDSDVGPAAVAMGSVGLVLGRGLTRAVLVPSVVWARGGADVVTLGVSAGITRGFGRP